MFNHLIDYLYWKQYSKDVKSEDFIKEERDMIFADLEGNEDFKNLLRSIISGDKNRYFRVSDDKSRNIIRGEYLRTLWFLKEITKTSEPKVGKKSNTKMRSICCKCW